MHDTFDRESIQTFVTTFYARVRQHPVLATVFSREIDDWAEHEERLVDFWSTVLLAEARYKGNPLTIHQRLPDLSAEHFDVWLALFEETASAVFSPRAARGLSVRARRIGSHMQARLGLEPTGMSVAGALSSGA